MWKTVRYDRENESEQERKEGKWKKKPPKLPLQQINKRVVVYIAANWNITNSLVPVTDYIGIRELLVLCFW